ncbi:MAG TPA: aspartyl protease family protein [Thermoanaerobaculia bacterium]
MGFEFISRKGYGKNALQRDDRTLATLETARKAMRSGIVPKRASRSTRPAREMRPVRGETERPPRRPVRLHRSGWIAAALCGLAAFCATSPEIAVLAQKPEAIRVVQPVPGPLSADDCLASGQYLEIERYVGTLPSAAVEKSPSLLALYGKALLARGDFHAAWPVLERARSLESRAARRGEIAWTLSQGAILWNDFASAHDYAEAAVQDGYGLVPGFLRFLAAMRDVDVYAGPPVGETHTATFDMRTFNLIRVPVRVNGRESAAILDSGAAYTIVTESFAQEARVRRIPDSRASGRGLHKKEFPVTFGVIAVLDFAGFSVRDVPVMVMPDEALAFETSRGPFPVPAVLGLHLLKEFSTEIDYRSRRLELTRADFRLPKRENNQNLFFSRGRLFVRASINRGGFYAFLLDTGSEPTLMTSPGLARARLPASNKLFPKRVHGIGKTHVEWGLIREVSIGIGEFAVRFRDLAVKDDEDAFESGIVGTSYLQNFRVRLDFARMVLTLERES